MTILVAISALGSLSAHIMTSSRLCFVGARKGHIPTCLSLVSVKHSTPEPALIFLVSAILKSDRLFTSRTANRVCVPSAPASTTEPPDMLPRQAVRDVSTQISLDYQPDLGKLVTFPLIQVLLMWSICTYVCLKVLFRESMIFFFKKNPRFFQTIFKNACAVISYAKYLCRKYRTKYSIFAYPHEFLNKVFCFITGRFIMSVPVCR